MSRTAGVVLAFLGTCLPRAASADETTPAEALTLDRAIAIALERTNDVIQARADLLLADVEKVRALSTILPRFDLAMSAGESFLGKPTLEMRNRGSGPFIDQQSGNSSAPVFQLALSGQQLIFDGGRWWTVLARADRVSAQSRAALRAVESDVRTAVVRAFYDLEKAERSVDTFALQLKNDEAQVERVRSMVQTGIGRQADVASAERNSTEDRITMASLKYARLLAGRTLNIALGRPSDDPIAIAIDSAIALEGETPPLEKTTGSELVATAIRARPELEVARVGLEIARQAVTIQTAAHYPTVALGASYAKASRKPVRVFGDPSENYVASIDLIVVWNLFTGLEDTANIEAAEIALSKSEAALANLERSIGFEVNRAFDTVQLLTEQHALSLQSIRSSETAVELARGMFQAGRGTLLEQRDSEVRLTFAKLAAIQARLDLEVARAELARATGARLDGE